LDDAPGPLEATGVDVADDPLDDVELPVVGGSMGQPALATARTATEQERGSLMSTSCIR
jgi:hypothetical protein